MTTYSMAVGHLDAAQLALVDRFYNPSSRAFCESAGISAGDTVAEIGCGHGSMTRWLAERVGPGGVVHAVDASLDQLEVTRRALEDLPQVRFEHARIEDAPLDAGVADWVYSRFLLMHVSDAAAALAAMARLLTSDGALLLEMSDIASQRFVPDDDPAANLWQRWWFALGDALGASYDIFDRTPDLLKRAGSSSSAVIISSRCQHSRRPRRSPCSALSNAYPDTCNTPTPTRPTSSAIAHFYTARWPRRRSRLSCLRLPSI